MTDDMMREEMVMMKEMGVNFIRLGHYQQSRTILDLCDSLGIVVWEEIPWCRGGLGGEVYREQGRRMLTNMIEKHNTLPSSSGLFLPHLFDSCKERGYPDERVWKNP